MKITAVLILGWLAFSLNGFANPPLPYKDQTLTLVVGYGPGGGFDIYARLLAPYLERALQGTVVVENRPGGSGLTALNQLLRRGDSHTLMLLHGESAAVAQLTQHPVARYDLAQLAILGRVDYSRRVLIAGDKGSQANLDTWLDGEVPVRFAIDGPTSGIGVSTKLFCRLLAVDCRLVSGYPSSKNAALGVMRGEADAMILTESSALSYTRDNRLTPLLNLEFEPLPLLPDLPPLDERLAFHEQQRLLFEFRSHIGQLGRLLVAPPTLDDGQLTALRRAAQLALADPELLAQAAQLQRPINYLSGPAAQALVADIFGATGLRRRFVEALKSDPAAP